MTPVVAGRRGKPSEARSAKPGGELASVTRQTVYTACNRRRPTEPVEPVEPA